MGALVGTLINIIGNALKNPSNAGNSTESLSVWIGQLSGTISELAKGILKVLGREHDEWRVAETDAKQVGHDLEAIQGSQEQVINRLTGVIIPESLTNLLSFVTVRLIRPLQHSVAVLDAQVIDIVKWEQQTDVWRRDTVMPDLRKLLAFVKWFDGWPLQVVNTWHEWFRKPGLFGDWAAAPITGPLIKYLADPSHSVSRDNLLQLLVDASPDRWRHIEAATLTILEQDYP